MRDWGQREDGATRLRRLAPRFCYAQIFDSVIRAAASLIECAPPETRARSRMSSLDCVVSTDYRRLGHSRCLTTPSASWKASGSRPARDRCAILFGRKRRTFEKRAASRVSTEMNFSVTSSRGVTFSCGAPTNMQNAKAGLYAPRGSKNHGDRVGINK